MKKSENYQEDILNYLEAKYNEKFTVESMSKEVGFGSSDVIRAIVYSKKFPDVTFTVNYQLKFSDVHDKEEIEDLLKQADVYSEEYLKEWENDVEPYFEDDYANIINQNKFDNIIKEKLEINKDFLLKSVFTTPNHYPDLDESQADLSTYMGSENYDLYAYHFIFLKDDGDTDDSKLNLITNLSNSIANISTRKQYVLFYFISDFDGSNLEQKFFEYYKDPNEYFSNLESTTSNGIVTIDKGIVKESNEDILKMLGGN